MTPSGTELPLADYWSAAASAVPIVILGGGRWGRVWAHVIAEARGTAAGIVIAARTDPDGVRNWLKDQPRLADIGVVTSLGEALELNPKPIAAIVASRPRDHVRDAIEALNHGLHVLVEKPVSPLAAEAGPLISAARNAGLVLAVGTEFAFLPAFHWVSRTLAGSDPVRLSLHWDDPVGEMRHGAVKAHHEETSVLADLLPHAFSIFRIFAPQSVLRIDRADLSADGNSGEITLLDNRGGRFELHCDRAASARRRVLEISHERTRAVVDFAAHPPAVTIDGQVRDVGEDLSAFSSTLRLELGAFLMEAAGAANTPISAGLADLIRLQGELETAGAA